MNHQRNISTKRFSTFLRMFITSRSSSTSLLFHFCIFRPILILFTFFYHLSFCICSILFFSLFFRFSFLLLPIFSLVFNNICNYIFATFYNKSLHSILVLDNARSSQLLSRTEIASYCFQPEEENRFAMKFLLLCRTAWRSSFRRLSRWCKTKWRSCNNCT